MPDVSGSEPKAGLASLKGQAPMAIQGALGSVSQAVSTAVGDKKQALAANPPTRAASSGMPGKKGTARRGLDGGGKGGKKADKVTEGAAVETPAAEPVPEAPAPAVNAVTAPPTSGAGEGEMSQQDADRMGSAVDNMPTSDPEVSTSAGPPPTLALEGNADPAQVTAQRVKMDHAVAAAHDTGKADARKPMGENEIAPQETHETLAAKVPASGAAAGGGPAGGGGGSDAEAASIIAQEKSQGEIDAAVEKGQGDMAQEEAKEQEASAAETQRTEELAAQAESDAAAEQEAEKASAQNEVAKKRGEWSDEQQAAVDKGNTEADTKQQEADEKVESEKTQADESAGKTIAEGEEKAQKEKEAGEAKAEREKAKAKEESSGFFGWLASKAKAFFNKIKEAVKSVMKALRAAVKAAIEAAKKAAVALIEKARQAVVAAIRLAGDALIAISDVALAAFPELKAKFQGAVRQTVQDAEDTVNRIADKLKKGVTKLLDALGEFLDKALGLLEKGLLAAVDAVAAVVDSAIKAAEAVAKALGTFLALIKDIAAGPGQWISNLGAAVVDGIKNHLVKAMKAAISDWFKSKVEEVLGIPIDLMKALFTGGFNLDAIGKMAWEALKTAVPGILIQLLIEKLVAMIVPAAGAVMAIIEGVQAAWGAVSRIIAAIDSFITFLKAVKGGNAGPQFATAVAAGAVAVIDFVANWLIKRLMKPAKKVSGKLAAIAKKILAKIKKGLKKVGKKLKKFFKKAGQKLKKLKDKLFGKKKKGKDKKKDKEKDKKKEAVKRLKRARRAIAARLRKPKKGRDARSTIQRVAAQHKVSATISVGADTWQVTLKVNPDEKFSLHETDNTPAQQGALQAKTTVEDMKSEAAQADQIVAAVVPTPSKTPTESGEAKEKAKLEAIQSSPDQTLVPTKPGHLLDEPAVKGPGFDAAALKSEKGEDVLELFEEKSGKPRVLLGHSSSRPLPRGKEVIDTTGEGSARAKVVNDAETAKKIAGDTAVLRQDGRQMQNQLGAITSKLRKNIEKMRKALADGVKKKKVDPQVKDKVDRVLNGQGGLLRIVIDLDRGAAFSASDLEAAKTLLTHAIDRLKATLESQETRIEAVIREAGKDSDTVIYG
ncbi:hypothetical protein HMI49_37310 [Corallococcus exercitus]|uniref:Uncharacterized protein n=1 Tax=Corallococcus exercitus TaxID=2316736 RepID=A0A7Y4KRX3_9BACT|nr:hypothetical protein [Corallococcus exercitus]